LRFRNGNKKYLKIKSIAEEQVNRLLTEQAGLLISDLLAVIEGLRMNPDRYAIIYDNKHDNNDSGKAVEVPAITIADLLTVIRMMLLRSVLCIIKYTLKPFWFISLQRVSICLRLVIPLKLLLVLHVDLFLELT
jgi:hypothetical protein